MSLSLALVLALAAMTIGGARGQVRGPGDRLVICSGTGLSTVYMDEHGRKVPHVHICPDCVPALVAAVWADPPQLLRPILRGRRIAPAGAVAGGSRPRPGPQARGPPAPVPA